MQMFEYIIVLISIVLGLALTHLMQGVAGLIQHPERARIWWVHLVWVAYMFLNSIFWWWYEFRLQRIEEWTFSLYAFVVFYAFYIYLICALLFPRDLEGYDGYRDYFLSRRKWFFGLLTVWAAIDLIDTAIKNTAEMNYFASLGTEYLISQVALTLGSVVGLVSGRASVHATIAVLFLIYQISWVLRMFSTVN
jgi:hypothetical protein